MAKKRPTLDAFLTAQKEPEIIAKNDTSVTDLKTSDVSPKLKSPKTAKVSKDISEFLSNSQKHEVVRHMLYLPLPVYDQLQSLVFEEQRGQTKRRKTHDYLLDAIDLLFKKKGLKSIKDIVENK